MADLELTLSMLSPHDRVMPLFTGEVKPEGITLRCIDSANVDLFYDVLKFDRYDVSEMSVSSFLAARAKGWGYVALPVFQHRAFHYTKVLVRVASGIRKPEDLKGKRVGSADYQQTAALWTRGILQHEFGVKPQDMVWYQERAERFSHGGASGFKPPAGVRFHYATTDFGTMFLRGELDAAITYQTGAKIDRPKIDLSRDRRFRPLFRDPVKEAVRFYKKHQIVPVHHLTVVRESIVKEHPWVATSLMDAFERAKKLAMERLYADPPTLMLFGGHWLDQQKAVFGDDPYRYGLKANAKEIDLAQTYSAEQGLTPRKQPWEELFAEEVLVAEEK
ncbi:MAG: hypothetical protein HY535_07230 [Chloroflexi bacterium]|nr:hypothetical protein [Chloroflexota bacterium]